MFKAWNTETRLMMRLNQIDCKRGELFRKDHILLQFTGLYDRNEEEIYEMDVMLVGERKFVVVWDEGRSGWCLAALEDRQQETPFVREDAVNATRLWNYFETEEGR